MVEASWLRQLPSLHVSISWVPRLASFLPATGIKVEVFHQSNIFLSRPSTGCAAIRFLGSNFVTARPHLRCLLLVIARGTARRLLPSDRSWDCTANTFLHRLRSTTSSNALCLVWMETPMPSAWDLPLGTLLTLWLPYFAYLLYRSVCHTSML
jgi:hypothetical protein